MLRWLFHICLALALTLLTLVGGVAWLVSRVLPRQRLIGFCVIYGLLSLSAGAVAPFFGKERLQCFASEQAPYKAHSMFYCLANRNYVTPEMKAIVEQLAHHMTSGDQDKRLRLRYLDGSFPIGVSIPLLPHLSHKDGGQLDLSLYYEDSTGELRGGGATFFGYFGFPAEDPPICVNYTGRSMRWRYGDIFPWMWRIQFADSLNTKMIAWIGSTGQQMGIKTAFLEPYLQEKWQARGSVFKFQGCYAARHDDHIHIQL